MIVCNVDSGLDIYDGKQYGAELNQALPSIQTSFTLQQIGGCLSHSNRRKGKFIYL